MNVDYRAEIIAWVDPDANGERHIFEEMLDQYEQQIRQQIVNRLESIDPVIWALAGQYAGRDAVKIVRGEKL